VVAGGRRRQPCASEKGGSATGPSPVDRARNGSKHHLLVDATGIPLACTRNGPESDTRGLQVLGKRAEESDDAVPPPPVTPAAALVLDGKKVEEN
jgi:hypothetical protein